MHLLNVRSFDADNAVSLGSRPIALFSPSLAGGGAERVLLNLARGLRELGHEVDVVLAKATGELLTQIPADLNVIDLNASRTLTCLPALIRYIRRERPSGIIAFQDHANVVALWASAIAGVRTPVIPTVHNTWSRVLHTGTWKTRALARFVGFAYRRTPRIVAVSEGAADDLAQQFQLSRDLVTVIYNPVTTPQLFEKASEPVEDEWFEQYRGPWIVAVGRLSKQKDFANLIDAFSCARTEIDCKLLILGEGEDRPALEHLIRRLGIESHCCMPGFVDNPYKYLSRAALFVLSSAWEGLPTVLIEALALGVPVVSTDCKSGPREILRDGQFGFLVPPSNPEALSAAIITALRNPISVSGHAVDRFVSSVASKQYESLLAVSGV
jgi:glycosyltransferase involved in cell wall biosynthesis